MSLIRFESAANHTTTVSLDLMGTQVGLGTYDKTHVEIAQRVAICLAAYAASTVATPTMLAVSFGAGVYAGYTKKVQAQDVADTVSGILNANSAAQIAGCLAAYLITPMILVVPAVAIFGASLASDRSVRPIPFIPVG